MTKPEMLALMRKVLALPESFELADNISPTQVPGWDSMGWLNLIMAIEQRLGTELPAAEIDRVFNIGDLYRLVSHVARGRTHP
jgi:acyl carrier protein